MGRGYKHVSSFSPNDSNSICDLTGQKRKLSELMQRWDGFFMIPKGWNPREAQDFPITAQRQQVYKDARSEQAQPSEAAQPPITPL